MKKILFLFHDINMTGSSISLLRIIETLASQNKYDIYAVLPSIKGPINESLAKHKIKVYAFTKHDDGGKLTRLSTFLIYFLNYTFTLVKISPAIVYSNTLTNIGEVIISRLMGIYTLVHSHEGKKFIEKHALLIKLADFFTSEYIVVSQYALKSLETFTKQKSHKNIVYNGIEIREKKNPLFCKENTIKLSVIATIDRNKSQLTAIKALKLLLNATSFKFRLNFFGKIANEEYYQELINYINANNLTNHIHFHGEIAKQHEMYEQTDILLITSLDETFSLTALEALIASVPVVASKVGGIPEVIENNVSGLLFKAGDFKELSEHISHLLANDSLWSWLIENGYKQAIEKFSIDSTVKKVSSIIDKALASAK